MKKPNAPALNGADESLSALVASVVAENPRGAPITLPAPACVLDDARVNSTLTILAFEGKSPAPFLMTPDGEVDVPKDDYSKTLPLLAEIRKIGDNKYVARQLDDQMGFDPLTCESAVECIRLFKKHFHGER